MTRPKRSAKIIIKNKIAAIRPTVEYLSKDIFDEHFLKVFSTFLLFQKILGVCRVDARDRFVTPPTIYQKLYSILHTSVAIITLYVGNYIYFNKYYAHTEVIFLVICAYVTMGVKYISTVLYARFANHYENTKFYIKMQEIDRLLGIDRDKLINDMLRRSYNTTLWIIIVQLLTLFLLACYGGLITAMAFLGLLWCNSASIMELSNCANLILYFIIRVRYINCIVLNHLKGRGLEKNPRVMWIPLVNVMRYLVHQNRHDFRNTDTDVYLKELLEFFTKFQDLYRFPIAVYFINLLIFYLASVRFIVIGISKNILSYMEGIMIPVSIVLSILQTFLLSTRFEWFFREVKFTRRLAVAVMSRSLDGSLREKAKIILKLVHHFPPRFSVYDMWHMEGIFLVTFTNVTANLIITQLQFLLL